MAPTSPYTTESLAREHDVLANMQGAESRRVDILVDDVGKIKGSVERLHGDIGRVGTGVEQLQQSMVALNRHSILLESQQAANVEMRRDTEALDARVRVIEMEMPALKEVRSDYRRVILGVLAAVGAAMVAVVIKSPYI